ncbi:endolysin-like domain-containing protein [Anaerotignum sp.]
MAVLCGWASQDERAKASGGKAGDQTGKEVKTGSWYDFGQTAVYRWKDRSKAKTYASIIKYWCNDSDVGYDQNQRTTLGAWCKKHDWSYKVNTPVETDCSRMVADGINCTMKKEVFTIGSTFYTGNLGDKLMATGLFTKLTGSKYCDQDAYLMVGDIINNPARHVITALANGSKASTSSTTTSKKKSIATVAQEVIAGKWGNGETRKKKLKAAGYDYAAVQKKVDELMKPKKKSITTIAKEVINGDWGNGSARIRRLKAAGYDPVEVQKKVNQLEK